MSDAKDKKRLGWEDKDKETSTTEVKDSDTTVNVNVDTTNPSDTTVVEKRTEKKVVTEKENKDEWPTPSTESA